VTPEEACEFAQMGGVEPTAESAWSLGWWTEEGQFVGVLSLTQAYFDMARAALTPTPPPAPEEGTTP
jgi:hypothetical protein